MGVISGSNTVTFKPATFIYSKVRRFLSSYDAANLIDEGEFPTYTKEVLRFLGSGAYMETQAITKVINKRAKLPDNFAYLYVAYKCEDTSEPMVQPTKHYQNGFAFVTDITQSYLMQNKDCEITCCEENERVLEKIEVQQYVVEEKANALQFGRIAPLRLSPNVSTSNCVDGNCGGMLNDSPYEITIDNGYIYTNFDGDYVYLKYYGFPVDDDGELLIPDIESVEKAIEWYIIYQILLGSWFNSSVPDIQNKWQKAEMEYTKYFSEAKYFLKLPSFHEMVNTIRNQRSQNKMVFFTRQMQNTNFQRSR